MRKRINLWIAMALSIIFLSVSGMIIGSGDLFNPYKRLVQAAFASGDGLTPGTAFIINDLATLNGTGENGAKTPPHTDFRAHVNANVDSATPIYYKLGANINLTSLAAWTPITRFGPNMFLDGGGYKIENMRGTNATFFTNFQGTIENVEFVNPRIGGPAITAASGVVASVVERTATGPGVTVNARIENVHVTRAINGDIGTVEGSRAGGLVGSVGVGGGQTVVTAAGVDIVANEAVAPGSVNLAIVESSNSANISGTSTADLRGNGGLIGYINRAHVNIWNSENTGNVRMVASGNQSGVGGLVGLVTGTGVASATPPATTAAAALNISASKNRGVVAFGTTFVFAGTGQSVVGSTLNNANTSHGAGGLVGMIHSLTNTAANITATPATDTRIQVNIRASSNEATGQVFLVSGGTNANNDTIQRGVGGLVGDAARARMNISYSKNLAPINARTPSQNNVYINVGGIVGRVFNSDTTIASCFNSGNLGAVDSNGGGTQGGGLVGGNYITGTGIVGTGARTSITGSANTGSASGNVGTGFPGLVTGGTSTQTGSASGSATGPAGDIVADLENDIADEIEAVIYGEWWVDISTSTKYTIESPNRFDEGKGYRTIGGGNVIFTIVLSDGYEGVPVVRVFDGVTNITDNTTYVTKPADPIDGPFTYEIKNITPAPNKTITVEIDDDFAPAPRVVNLPKGVGYTLGDFIWIKENQDREPFVFSDVIPTYENYFRTEEFPHGEKLEFRITLLASHDVAAPTVTVGGIPALVEETAELGVYSVTFNVMQNNPLVVINVTRNSYEVTPPAAGAFDFEQIQPLSNMVFHGDYYVFDAVAHPHRIMTVRYRPFGSSPGTGTIITPDADGDYEGFYAIQVTQRIIIDITTATQEYTVTIPPHTTEPYEITFDAQQGNVIPYGEWFEFEIELDPSHNKTVPEIRQGDENGEIIDLEHVSGDIYTGRFMVLGPTTLWVQDDYATECINKYTIVAPFDDGVWFTYKPDAGNIATHGGEFKFEIEKLEAYDQGTVIVKIKVGSEPAEILEDDGDGITYTVDPVEGQFIIIVEMEGGVKLNEYAVTYLPGEFALAEPIARVEGQDDDVQIHGEIVEFKGVVFTSETHNHVAWSLEADGSTRDFEFGFEYDENEPITLYPYWRVKTYTITYTFVDPPSPGLFGTWTGSKTPDTKRHFDWDEEGNVVDPFTLPGETFRTAGWKQTGWEDGDKTPYAFGANVGNADLILYPVWQHNEYEVSVAYESLDENDDDAGLNHFGFAQLATSDGTPVNAGTNKDDYLHGVSVFVNIVPDEGNGGAVYWIRVSHDGGTTWVEEIPYYSVTRTPVDEPFEIGPITDETLIAVEFREVFDAPDNVSLGFPGNTSNTYSEGVTTPGYRLDAVLLNARPNRQFSFTITFLDRFSQAQFPFSAADVGASGRIINITGWEYVDEVSVLRQGTSSTFLITLDVGAIGTDSLVITVAPNASMLNKYNVTYLRGEPSADISGTVPATQRTHDEVGFRLSTTPFVRVGWRQTGWTDGTTTFPMDAPGAPYNVNAHITLVPVWAINTSTLIINPNPDSNPATVYTGETNLSNEDYNTFYDVPNPTRPGWTFGGWTRTGSANGNWNAGTRRFTFGEDHNTTTTLTAIWTINKSTLIIVPNPDAVAGTVYTGETNLANRDFNTFYDVPNPSRPGWTFGGWTRTGSENGSWSAGTGRFVFGEENTTTTTLTAIWTQNRSRLVIDAAGGEYLGLTTIDGLSGSTHTVLASTRAGFRFDGWTAAGDYVAGWTNNATTGTYTFSPTGGAAVAPFPITTLTAQWTPITYTMAFAKGTFPVSSFGPHEIGGSEPDGTKEFTENFRLPGVVFTTTGYTQIGWAITDGGPLVYSLNGWYTTNPGTPFATVTFYPVWQHNRYTVDLGSGTGYTLTGSVDPDARLHGEDYTITVTLSGLYVNTIPVVRIDGVWMEFDQDTTDTHIWTYTWTMTDNIQVRVELLYTLVIGTGGDVEVRIIEIENRVYTLEVEISPDNHYIISVFTVNGGTITNRPSTHDIEDVTSARVEAIRVEFDRPMVTMTFLPNGGLGSTTPRSALNGSTAFTNVAGDWAFAKTGYQLYGWSISGNKPADYTIGTAIPYSLENNGKTFLAIWEERPFTVLYDDAVDEDEEYITTPAAIRPTGPSTPAKFTIGQSFMVSVNPGAGREEADIGWQISLDGDNFITLMTITLGTPAGTKSVDLRHMITIALLETEFGTVPASTMTEFTIRPMFMDTARVIPVIGGDGSGVVTLGIGTQISELASGGETSIKSGVEVTITITPNRHNKVETADVNGVAIASLTVGANTIPDWISPLVVVSKDFNATTGGNIVIASLLADIDLEVEFEAIIYDVKINAVSAVEVEETAPSSGIFRPKPVPGVAYPTEEISVVTTDTSNPQLIWFAPKSAAGYSFNSYTLMTAGGTPYNELVVGSQELFGQFSDGFMWLTLTEEFPNEFLHAGTEIVINASYKPERTTRLTLGGSWLSVQELEDAGIEVFLAYNDGEGLQYFDSPWVANPAGLNSEIRIEVRSGGYHEIRYRVTSGSATINTEGIAAGVLVFSITEDVVIEMDFVQQWVGLVAERLYRDGTRLDDEEIIGSGWEISDTVWSEDIDLEAGEGYTHEGKTLQHVAWRIRMPDGTMVDIATGKFGATPIADFFAFETLNPGTVTEKTIIKDILFAPAFVNALKNRDNEIVVVAIFSDKLELSIAVSDNSEKPWHNRYVLKINGTSVNGTTWANATNPFATAEFIDCNYDTLVEIIPLPSDYYRYKDIVGAEGLVFNLRMDRDITVNFESKQFTMNTANLPSHTLQIDNVEQTSEIVTFAIGNTVSITFDAPDMQVFKTMRIGDVDISEIDIPGMVYRNGKLTINVTVDWLVAANGRGWLGALNSNTPGFTPTIEIDTEMNPMIIGGMVAVGVIALVVLIGIIFMIISLRRKRADYKVALAKHKEGMSRLKQNIISDLVKD